MYHRHDHLGSISIPEDQGYKCALYVSVHPQPIPHHQTTANHTNQHNATRMPDCGLGQSTWGPICVVGRSLPDLLTLEGNPCPNSMVIGVGFQLESAYCYRE